MEEIKYKQTGFNKHMHYDQSLFKACKGKDGLDRLDSVSRLRKIDEPVRVYVEANWDNVVSNFWTIQNQEANRNATEMHLRRVQEQTNVVVEINKVGPGNVGTVDVKQAFLTGHWKNLRNIAWNQHGRQELNKNMNDWPMWAAILHAEDVNSNVDMFNGENMGGNWGEQWEL